MVLLVSNTMNKSSHIAGISIRCNNSAEMAYFLGHPVRQMKICHLVSSNNNFW